MINPEEESMKISTPKEHRELLLGAMQDLIAGRVDPREAEALSALSDRVHDSIQQEWDMRVFASQRMKSSGVAMEMLGYEGEGNVYIANSQENS